MKAKMCAPRLIFLDHEDSFSATLARLLRSLGAQLDVFCVERLAENLRDPLNWHEALAHCQGLVLSPGPGHPKDYFFTLEHLEIWKNKNKNPPPLLGVCLGLQLLACSEGVPVVNLKERGTKPVHGRRADLSWDVKKEWVLQGQSLTYEHTSQGSYVLFNSLGVPQEDAGFLESFEVAAYSEGIVQLALHKRKPWIGCQFHPESFASSGGLSFLKAFVELAAQFSQSPPDVDEVL
jgi:anthranilate/para-aminobenzoate synthase component II